MVGKPKAIFQTKSLRLNPYLLLHPSCVKIEVDTNVAVERQPFSPMQKIKKFGTTLVSIVLVVGSVYGIWWLVSLFHHVFVVSSPPVQAAVIAGSATVLISVFSLIWSARQQIFREIQAEHRKQKSEIYEEFIQFLFDALLSNKLGKPAVDEQKMAEYFAKFNQRMIVWGSDEVMKEYILFRARSANAANLPPKKMLQTWEQLLYAIRRDLGHNNKDLDEGDLLRLFINDYDEYINGSG